MSSEAETGAEAARFAIPSGPLRSFRGAALIQYEGEVPREAASGTMDLELLYRGTRESMVATVSNGAFEVEIPTQVRVVLRGATFEGQSVHFEAPKGPFDPSGNDYALVGIVSPAIRLIVRDGSMGTPLGDVSVHRAEEATSAWMDAERDAGEVVIDSAPSPVRLPHIDATRPVWLRVTAPGYAATHILVDPRKASEQTVQLWPSADLTVNVRGKGRNRLRMLVLTRDEGGGVTPHTGTFGANHKAVEKGPSSFSFPIQGLAALPHTITAKGYDPKGVIVQLGEPVKVDLRPNDVRSIELHID